MARHGVHALLVPSADPHLSEYLPGRWQTRQWLSGFTGSMATLVVTADDAALFADEAKPRGDTTEQAERFIRALAAELGVPGEYVQPGYEDVFYYLWRERRLPTNLDPCDAKLDDEVERDRLRQVFMQGLDAVVGFALPLKPTHSRHERWRSGPWFLRSERLYLFPGDSPMGFRLPLDSLPWASEDDAPPMFERDPLAPRPPLPSEELQRFRTPATGSTLASQVHSFEIRPSRVEHVKARCLPGASEEERVSVF